MVGWHRFPIKMPTGLIVHERPGQLQTALRNQNKIIQHVFDLRLVGKIVSISIGFLFQSIYKLNIKCEFATSRVGPPEGNNYQCLICSERSHIWTERMLPLKQIFVSMWPNFFYKMFIRHLTSFPTYYSNSLEILPIAACHFNYIGHCRASFFMPVLSFIFRWRIERVWFGKMFF